MSFFKRTIERASNYLSRLWNRQLLVFLFFVAISTSFWIFTVSKEVKEYEFDVTLKLINVPDNVVITTEPPKKISIKLKDETVKLWRYAYHKKNFQAVIDWNDVNNSSGHVRLLSNNVLKSFFTTLSSSTNVISCRPDTIEFYYNYGLSKQVPVIFQGTVEADSAYNLIARDIAPRHVTVYASKSVLDTITGAYIKPVNIHNVKDTASVMVRFQKVKGAKFVPSTAKLTMYADRMIEKTVQVPVQGVNFPAGKSLRTFPTKVDVTFLIGTSLYKTIEAENFVIVVNYEDLISNDTNRCPLRLKSTPFGVQRARIHPSEVEYVIEESSE